MSAPSSPAPAGAADDTAAAGAAGAGAAAPPTFDSGDRTCLCGNVKFRVNGPVVGSAFCHCTLCRRYFAQPFNIVAIFAAGSMTVEREAETCESYATSESFSRVRCRRCGATVRETSPTMPLDFTPLATLVDAATTDVPDVLRPTQHIFYANRLVDVNDTLPKYAGFAADYSKTPPPPLPAYTADELKASARKMAV